VAHRADRFDLGEVFLEIGLIITALTLLTEKKAFWLAGILVGLVGLVLAFSGFAIH
jgi:hypothetical protein